MNVNNFKLIHTVETFLLTYKIFISIIFWQTRRKEVTDNEEQWKFWQMF